MGLKCLKEVNVVNWVYVIINFVEWFYFCTFVIFYTEYSSERERERETHTERFFEFNGNIIWLWYSRWVDWILKFVIGNDLYDRFEFDTFYSLYAFPKA